MNLIIDIGNSSCKSALFEQGAIKEFHKGSNSLIECLDEWRGKHEIEKAIVSSVIEIPATIVEQLEALPCPYIQFSTSMQLPVKILYRTPHTLGADRIAAVIGAQSEAPKKDILVIDAGSAITYDFLDAQGNQCVRICQESGYKCFVVEKLYQWFQEAFKRKGGRDFEPYSSNGSRIYVGCILI